MSAPGLDLQIMESMDFPVDIFRTSVNFMGCYAAIHGMKLADAFCKNDKTCKGACCVHGALHAAFSKRNNCRQYCVETFVWGWRCRYFSRYTMMINWMDYG